MLDKNNFILTKTNAPNLSSWLKNLKEFELDNFFETRILGRGYEYVKGIQIEELTNDKLTAKSCGSNEYDLYIQFNKTSLYASCSCPYDGACKHLAGLLLATILQAK